MAAVTIPKSAWCHVIQVGGTFAPATQSQQGAAEGPLMPQKIEGQKHWVSSTRDSHRKMYAIWYPKLMWGWGVGWDKFILFPCYHVQRLYPQHAMTNPQDTGKIKGVLVIYSSFIFEETSFCIITKKMYHSHRILGKYIKGKKKRRKMITNHISQR